MTADTNPIAGRHLVRYGIAADQKFLLGEFLQTYNQIVLNANIVAHMRSALANFLSDRARKPYFIDPQTHAFQHDITHLVSSSETVDGKIKLKSSIRKLLEEYGEPVKTCVGSKHSSVVPEDFDNPNVRRGFCERVLRFQLRAIEEEMEASDSAKYHQYRARKGGMGSPGFRAIPTIVVAPYFHLTSTTFGEWVAVNINFAKDSEEYALSERVPLAVQIVISRDLLVDRELRTMLVKRYRNAGVDANVFLIWVDSFSEREASERELAGFIDLVNDLGSISPVVNLYGGFFSVALSRCGVVKSLVGISHGLEYGEDRAVIPVGGGIPVAKYYVPALHARLPFRDALRAVRTLGGMRSVDDFLGEICDCKECKQVITADPVTDFEKYGRTRTIPFTREGHLVRREYPTPETKEHCVKHYMWRKAREHREPLSADELVHGLREAERKLAPILGLDAVAHCGLWSKVLGERSKQI